MKNRTIALLIVLGILAPLRSAFADNAAPPALLRLHSASMEGTEVHALVSASAAPALPTLFSLTTQSELRSTATRAPLDLWLLVDNSSLCSRFQVEQTVAAWLNALKQNLPGQSKISVVTYRRGALEVLSSHNSAAQFSPPLVQCQNTAVSAEPEKAIEQALEAPPVAGLTKVLWVLSSGNYAVSARTMASVKAQNIQTFFFLYNAAVAKAITPLIEAWETGVGKKAFSSFTMVEPTLIPPIQTFWVKAAVPRKEMNGPLSLVARLKSGENGITSQPLLLSTASPASLSWGEVLFWTLLTVALIYLGFRIFVRCVRYYRPRHCHQCSRRMRYIDRNCGFCRETPSALLLWKNPRPELKGTITSYAALEEGITEIGTHRRSRIRLLRLKGFRKECAFTIRRSHAQFVLEPKREKVYVNRFPVAGQRFLRSGDCISTGRFTFQFKLSEGIQNA
jgi:hypothetical protein